VASAPVDPPLHVDWIDERVIRDGLPGRLGLTFLPGKRGASERYPGLVYRRELEADLATLRRHRVRSIVLLVEDAELERWGDRDIVERAAAHGIRLRRYPMPDGAPPSSMSEMDGILDWLRAARGDGDAAVACMGGVGRSGTVAACALVEEGWEPDAAIAHVRSVRHPTAVETDAQVAFVHAYARHRAGHAGAG
jgi:protein-tyrosine phosphatase